MRSLRRTRADRMLSYLTNGWHGAEWNGRSPVGRTALREQRRAGRPEESPGSEGTVVGNAHRPRGQGQCHRKQTAGGFPCR